MCGKRSLYFGALLLSVVVSAIFIGVKVWIYNGDILSGREVPEEDKYAVKRKRS